MENCSWKTSLLLAVLPIVGISALPHKALTTEEALELGVAIYNSQAGDESLYRLLEAVPRPEWVLEVHSGLPPVLLENLCRDPRSDSNHALNFTIKETVCQAGDERSLEECDFQDDGVSDGCQSGLAMSRSPRQVCGQTMQRLLLLEERPPVVVLTCVTVARQEEEENEEEEEEEEEEDEEEEEKDQPRRVKRFKTFFKKLKKGVKNTVKKTSVALAARFRPFPLSIPVSDPGKTFCCPPTPTPPEFGSEHRCVPLSRFPVSQEKIVQERPRNM
ncbi:cathelicidin-related peptide Oh-Cath-like [Crotalus adamanteus]|uniref:Cathelicidin-related antimicrobial peptide n=1 Tax=Crotalus adamanteus TaxID=8729 RepID=A0AAW1B1Q3_CROAD